MKNTLTRSKNERTFFSILAVSAVAFTAVCLPSATPISANSCYDLYFIHARGSGQDLHAREYYEMEEQIQRNLKAVNSKLSINFFELGSDPSSKVRYPAVELNALNTIGAKISSGEAFEFGESVSKGITELKMFIDKYSKMCEDTKFVLIGYSQGAMVITKTIPSLDPKRIYYVATYGDPKLYLPEGKGLIPDACRGKNYSSYRKFAPNCRTKEGALGAKIPYQEKGWEGKIGLWCRDKDIICGAGIKIKSGDKGIIDSAIESHTKYADGGQINDIARTIVKKLANDYPDKINSKVISTGRLESVDTVVLLDNSWTMSNYAMEENIRQIIPKIGDKMADLPNGRIGLYAYSDYINEKPSRSITKLAKRNSIREDLATIALNGSIANYQNKKISLLSAAKKVMQEETWQAGASKSIVVITNNKFRNPDIDGTTLEELEELSLSIDPVSIYVIGPEELRDAYSTLTEKTGGHFYSIKESDKLINLLETRRAVNFSLSEYVGRPGDEIEFNVTVATEDDIVRYDWDLDFDGIYEVTTSIPSTKKIYNAESLGYIKVKAVYNNGQEDLGSVEVNITNSDEEENYYYLTINELDNLYEPSLSNSNKEEKSNFAAKLDTIIETSFIDTYSQFDINIKPLLVPNCGRK